MRGRYGENRAGALAGLHVEVIFVNDDCGDGCKYNVIVEKVLISVATEAEWYHFLFQQQ